MTARVIPFAHKPKPKPATPKPPPPGGLRIRVVVETPKDPA